MESTELLIEFDAGKSQGSLYFSGRDVFCAEQREHIQRHDLVWRSIEGWEKELLLAEAALLPKIKKSTGPAMLGEGGTLFHWDESNPYWIFVETEESAVSTFFQKWESAFLLSVCQRPDCQTVRFCLPAASLSLESFSCAV